MNSTILKFLVASVFLTLVGCATPNSLRQKPPVLDMNSLIKAKDVGVCIADKLEALGLSGGNGVISARETSDGYSVSVTQKVGAFGQDTIILVDITDTASGSHTRYFNNLLAGGADFAKAVKDCQGK